MEEKEAVFFFFFLPFYLLRTFAFRIQNLFSDARVRHEVLRRIWPSSSASSTEPNVRVGVR